LRKISSRPDKEDVVVSDPLTNLKAPLLGTVDYNIREKKMKLSSLLGYSLSFIDWWQNNPIGIHIGK